MVTLGCVAIYKSFRETNEDFNGGRSLKALQITTCDTGQFRNQESVASSFMSNIAVARLVIGRWYEAVTRF